MSSVRTSIHLRADSFAPASMAAMLQRAVSFASFHLQLAGPNVHHWRIQGRRQCATNMPRPRSNFSHFMQLSEKLTEIIGWWPRLGNPGSATVHCRLSVCDKFYCSSFERKFTI